MARSRSKACGSPLCGVAVMMTVLAVSLLGEGVQRALEGGDG